MMGPFSSIWLTLLLLCFFLMRVQTSVISDHFKNRVLDEQVIGQSVKQSLETEDDMMTQLNGGALTDFFHSYSVLEEDVKADVFKEPEGDETSYLIDVQDFLHLTDHDLPSSRSISPKFKGNAGNPQVDEDVTEGAEDSDQFHEHPSVDFVSDVLKNKMETTEASSEVLASSPPESKVMEESSQPAESLDLVTQLVLLSSSPPSSTPTLPPTLESSSTSESAPPPVFSPPAVFVPSPVGQPVSESSTPESSSTVSSSPSAMDDVDDGADSLDTLFMELENLNNLNQAVEALNQDPFDDTKAEDRTDVISDGYGNEEADDIFSDLFNWFG